MLTAGNNDTCLSFDGGATTATSDYDWTFAGTVTFSSTTSGLVIDVEGSPADQALVLGSSLTFAHGLGVTPKIVQVSLVCTTGEGGYTVGEIVNMPDAFFSGATDQGSSYKKDSTNVVVNTGTNVQVITDGGGSMTNLTAANWDVRVRAYA